MTKKRDLSGQVFQMTKFTHLNASGENLSDCRFFTSDFGGTKIIRSNFDGSYFYDCYMNGFVSSDSDFTDVEFVNCLMYWVRFTGSVLDNVKFVSTKIVGSKFNNASFVGASLVKCDLSDVDFTDVDFTGADLTGVFVSPTTIFRGADFRGATYDIDKLSTADLTNAKF